MFSKAVAPSMKAVHKRSTLPLNPLIHQLAYCISYAQSLPNLRVTLFTFAHLPWIHFLPFTHNMEFAISSFSQIPHGSALLTVTSPSAPLTTTLYSQGSPSAPCSQMLPSISKTSLTLLPSSPSSKPSHPHTASHS